jgi:pseudaminic acid biosynthesis-associated methylase
MGPQLDIWRGEFGDAWTDRNRGIDLGKRLACFRTMLAGLDLRRVLEVGCNRGQNLVVLRQLLGPGAELTGVEPNDYALGLAGQTGAGRFVAGHACALPFPDGHFDLVFTAGVLIHLAPAALPAALDELHRASRRYLLAVEYAAAAETVVPYRGHNELLFKRDFLAHFRHRFPGLAVVGQGEWPDGSGFDGTTWWLMDKAATAAREAA